MLFDEEDCLAEQQIEMESLAALALGQGKMTAAVRLSILFQYQFGKDSILSPFFQISRNFI